MTLPTNYDERDSYILNLATQGGLDVAWTPLVIEERGHRLELLVTARPVKADGLYFGAGARLGQQVADALGALLLTPKLLDLMFAAREVDVTPKSLYGARRPDGVRIDSSNMMDTATFEYHTTLLDEAISGRDGIVQTCGKPFVISKLASATHGVNYGWSLPRGTPSPWRGIAIYPSVTLTSMVIQQPSNAHGLDQNDYASTCQLAHRSCALDGAPRDLADIYRDPALASLVSHEGALPFVRQPGVPVFACALPTSLASGEPICPMPPRPALARRRSWIARNWKPVVGVTAGVAAIGVGVWAARRYGWI